MPDILIQITFIVGMIIIISCFAYIGVTAVKHYQKQKAYDQKKNIENSNLKILENRLPEVCLKNKGVDVDEVLGYIRDDTDIKFSMIWSDENGK